METIKVDCTGAGLVSLEKLQEFQGDLKSLSEDSYKNFKKNILENGICSAFHIWEKSPGDYWILDGHQRLRTLLSMRNEGYAVPDVPVNWVKARSKKEAKKKLLALASQYGRVDKQGLYEYLADSEITYEEFEMYELPEVKNKDFYDEYFKEESLVDEENPYTNKIKSPVYEIKGTKPSISSLVDCSKANLLIAEIEQANLSEEEKEFLRAAACRHAIFDYENIAEYYAHSSKEMQLLMEKSALVIIDFNQAIERGFVVLTEKIAKEFSEEYPNES